MFRLSVKLEVGYSVRCLLIEPGQNKPTKLSSESLPSLWCRQRVTILYLFMFSYEQSAQKLLFASTHWQLMTLYAQMYVLFIS